MNLNMNRDVSVNLEEKQHYSRKVVDKIGGSKCD